MKAWIKGGLIGIGICILLLLITLIFLEGFYQILITPVFLIMYYLSFEIHSPLLSKIIVSVASVVLWFIIGALIGWIIGRKK